MARVLMAQAGKMEDVAGRFCGMAETDCVMAQCFPVFSGSHVDACVNASRVATALFSVHSPTMGCLYMIYAPQATVGVFVFVSVL